MIKKVIEHIFFSGLKNILKAFICIPLLPMIIPILVFKSILGD